jgi:HAD superfamily hydrolase (TIGR01457 family)
VGLREKRLFLLDMDGTLYLGNRLFEKTPDFLAYVRDAGGKYLFLTNNSSKDAAEYVEKLKGMGIDAKREDFLTSVDAAARYLRRVYGGGRLYALGTAAFRRALSEAGLNVTDAVEDGVVCLVMGFDTELTFRKLEDACILLGRTGVGYVATNPDLVCPTEYGYVPDCGSVALMLKNATGREPVVIGKPQPAMPELALQRTGFPKEQTIIVGDRLYTDIACGKAAGIDSALVLSGETSREQLADSPHKPDYIFEDIAEMLGALKLE